MPVTSGTKQQRIKYGWPLKHFSTACYSLANVVLYFNAGNNFPKDAGWINHHLTDVREGWEIMPVIFLSLSSGFLLIGNYRAYLPEIGKLFSEDSGETNSTQAPSRLKKTCSSTITYWSDGYKTLITASSLFTFTQGAFFFFGQYAFIPAIIFSLMSFPGNFFAQYSILIQKIDAKIKIPFCNENNRHKIAIALAAFYTINQAALYFNSPDEFFQHVHIATDEKFFFNYHLSSFKNVGAGFGVVIFAIFSLILGYSNQTSYQGRIEKCIKETMGQDEEPVERGQEHSLQVIDEETGLISSKKPPARLHMLASITSACYKSLVPCSSFFAFAVGGIQPGSALIIAIILLVGNIISQYAIFSGNKERRSEIEEIRMGGSMS